MYFYILFREQRAAGFGQCGLSDLITSHTGAKDFRAATRTREVPVVFGLRNEKCFGLGDFGQALETM